MNNSRAPHPFHAVAGALLVASSAGAQPPPEPALEATPLEVTVRGETQADRLIESAESVKVVQTQRAQKQSADLGEVLARTQGIGVRRAGGLGSGTRFSLNGLTDDQVRFFLDGLPLELSGYPFGVANVPVNLVERAEVFSGVVPIRLGADALGGAVNLVTKRDRRGTHAHGSYEVGSFASHRMTLGARHLSQPQRVYFGANLFVDRALNRYFVDVQATDSQGKLYEAVVPRFHNQYEAAGINTEVAILDRPWARQLTLRGFASNFHREIQNNFPMTIPYGGVTYEERTYGATLKYEQDFGDRVLLEVVAGYTRLRGRFLDVDPCIYSWFGECLLEGRNDGETDGVPHDALRWDRAGFARLNVEWLPADEHALRVSLAPTAHSRTGDERRPVRPEERDPLTAQRDLLTLVSGVEYEANIWGESLQNIAFLKHYAQWLDSEDPTNANGFVDSSRPFRHKDRSTQHFGLGDSLRYRFSQSINGKFAYEWATRLPRAGEVFGDSALVLANLDLKPESSHNFNLGLLLDKQSTAVGNLRATANLFLRQADQLILLLQSARVDGGSTDTFQRYHNVYAARSEGIEASAGWTSPRQLLSLDTNLTYQDFRNTDEQGAFGDFSGDRIPNRPYFFANGSAILTTRRWVTPSDELSVNWHTRYVKGFYRSWESAGLREFKQVIPDQLVHSLSLVYLLQSGTLRTSSSLEVQNLSDARVYDFFGAQRPGRAVFLKTTLDY